MRAYLLPLACVLALASCDRNKQEKTVTVTGNGGTMTVSGNGEHFSVKDASGKQTVDINANGVTPTNLPDYVPVYPGAKVQSSVVGAGDKGNGGSIVIQTNASIADVVAFYKQKAAASGFSETMNMASAGTTMFTAASSDKKKTIEVIASTSDGATHAQIVWGGN